ncbi:hypothetical protein GYMLUDRAFT_64468 [Collybiopsis luxurians FD-317 M1]|uniref:Uncharacterized protein n=1 Tax=Collybiopsis luxurians FD-317 M1 TaxID=944289 RepID=A0A0D0CB51_9AGAR|nr:hypothetical protein GYMLUDRAFT_64468 [Collybiopsis luxurians FD-317 M1]
MLFSSDDPSQIPRSTCANDDASSRRRVPDIDEAMFGPHPYPTHQPKQKHPSHLSSRKSHMHDVERQSIPFVQLALPDPSRKAEESIDEALETAREEIDDLENDNRQGLFTPYAFAEGNLDPVAKGGDNGVACYAPDQRAGEPNQSYNWDTSNYVAEEYAHRMGSSDLWPILGLRDHQKEQRSKKSQSPDL